MKKAKLSIWNNKWDQTFDFSKSTEPNFKCQQKLNKDSMIPFVMELAQRKRLHGAFQGEGTSVKEIDQWHKQINFKYYQPQDKFD